MEFLVKNGISPLFLRVKSLKREGVPLMIKNVNVQDADDDVGGGGEGLGELGADLGDGHHVGPVHDLFFRQGLHLGKQHTPPHCTVLERHVIQCDL